MIAVITFDRGLGDEIYAYPFCETLLRMVLAEYKDIKDIRVLTKLEWQHGTDDLVADDLTLGIKLREIGDEFYTYPGQRAKLKQALKSAMINLDPSRCFLFEESGIERVCIRITERDLNRITDSLLKEV